MNLLIAFLLMSLTAPAQEPTPAQTFQSYRKALSTAKTYGEVLPFMESKGRAMIQALPEPTQAKMFDLLKKFESSFTDVKVAKETITGGTAVLELSGKDAKGQDAIGSVPMTKESDGWKVGTEKWSSKPSR